MTKQNISGSESWIFYIIERNGTFVISIPDCGGMADCVPKIQVQLEWCEENFDNLTGLRRTWVTVWETEDITVLQAVKKLIMEVKSIIKN